MTRAATLAAPAPVLSRHRPPKARIDPDRSKGWFRRVLPIVKAHRGMLAVALGASVVGSAIQVAIPDVIRQAIDNSLLAHRTALASYIWWAGLLGLATFALGYVSRRYLFEVAYSIEYDLRNILYEHLMGLSFSFYDRAESGQLMSRANSDVRAVQMFLTFGPAIVVQLFLFVFAFGVMLSISVPLALVAVCTLPLVFVTGARMRGLLFPISWVVQARLADAAVIVNENVEGTRIVKSFAAEGHQLGLLRRAARRIQWASIRQVDITARWSPAMQNLPRLGMAAVLLFGGWLALNHRATVGDLVAFSAYILMVQAPFQMLGMLMMQYQRAAASCERINEILDEQPSVVERPAAVDLIETRGAVSFEDVVFGYGDGPPVLDGFSLRIRPGETVALVGRTGSGKSTAARLIARFYDVGSGAVSIDGIDVRDLTLDSLRAAVGLVLDEPFLFSASVRDNIAYGWPDAPMEEVVRAARAAAAHEFITELPEGYDTLVGERGYTLSGGQRQRIAIARALLVDPRVLVLDDATSAIDVQVELRIHAALRELLGQRTTLLIAHRLSTINLADRVALVEDGRVVAVGSHAELLATEPRYSAVLAQVDDEAHIEGADRS